MKTTKPFSTISYNTDEFLQVKLDDLVQRRVISFYAFVRHEPEKDESKVHRHLIVFPNGQYQTDQLQDYLQQPDPRGVLIKPLGIMPCQTSKFLDWYLYSIHDAAYLASKGQTREFHYLEDDFITSDKDFFHEEIRRIDRSKYAKTQDFIDKVLAGQKFIDLVKSGQVPAPQYLQWRAMYELLHDSVVERNGGQSHSPIITDDGEILQEEDHT